jgi:FkbM family methyltransferase
MRSLKRRAVDIAERILGVKILRPGALGRAPLIARYEEGHLSEFFDRFQVDCVFDVGANEGQYVDRIRSLGFCGPIISFEPVPELANALTERSKADGNLFVEPIALDRSPGLRNFNVMARSDFSSFHAPADTETGGVFREMNSVERTIIVEARTLGQVYPKWHATLGFERPFLKIDTQGHDLAVSEGGLQVLNNFCGIQTELSVKRLYAGSPTYREALAFYESHGFQLSTLIINPHHFPHLFEMDAILLRE